MSTKSEWIKSTAPGYANSSNLLIEVKFNSDENWSKLWDSGVPNNSVREKDIQDAEEARDRWIATGPKKYYTAQYRIGTYLYVGGETGYAWRSIEMIRAAQ